MEKLVSCRWEVRNFKQSIMFTVYAQEMGEVWWSFSSPSREGAVWGEGGGWPILQPVARGDEPQRDIQSVPFSLKWKWGFIIALEVVSGAHLDGWRARREVRQRRARDKQALRS